MLDRIQIVLQGLDVPMCLFLQGVEVCVLHCCAGVHGERCNSLHKKSNIQNTKRKWKSFIVKKT